MEIVITDLTRFATGNKVCIAGIERNGGTCLRPMPYRTEEACSKLNILPGAILAGEFCPSTECKSPHNEDCIANKLQFIGPCSAQEFESILVRTTSFSIAAGFGITNIPGQKFYSSDNPPMRSLITIKILPQNISIVRDGYCKNKLRAIIVDNSQTEYRFLSITDLGFYRYAEQHSDDVQLAELNDFLHSQ
jgi:hypothetical protein